ERANGENNPQKKGDDQETNPAEPGNPFAQILRDFHSPSVKDGTSQRRATRGARRLAPKIPSVPPVRPYHPAPPPPRPAPPPPRASPPGAASPENGWGPPAN